MCDTGLMVDLNAGKQRPLQMFVASWQLATMLESLGPDATMTDLETEAARVWGEPVTITVYEDPP